MRVAFVFFLLLMSATYATLWFKYDHASVLPWRAPTAQVEPVRHAEGPGLSADGGATAAAGSVGPIVLSSDTAGAAGAARGRELSAHYGEGATIRAFRYHALSLLAPFVSSSAVVVLLVIAGYYNVEALWEALA